MKQLRPLCLASTSPRRRELLELFGLTFTTFAPSVDESLLPGETPRAHVTRLAETKAKAALKSFPDNIILAGDTIVVHNHKVLGKPEDAREAKSMLQSLSGETHQVISAYCLLDAPTGQSSTKVVETKVVFRQLTPEWIDWYSQHPESADKAGAYGIQGVGGAMVSGIEGSYNNVVGFPVEQIIWQLMQQGWLSL